MPGVRVFGIVDGVQFLGLAFGIIRDDDFDRAQHGEPAQRAFVQVLADGVFEHGHVGDAVVFGDADVVGKGAQGFRRDAAPADAGDGRHARVVPAGDEFFVHELHELAFAHDGVAEAEPGEFVLMRQRTRQVEAFQNPIVKRAVHLEFQRADAVRDAFDVIAQAMGEVIHRVDAPFAAGVMMFGVADAVEQRVAHPDVRRGHVNLRAERAFAVGKLAVLHAREQIEVFLDAAVAERAFLGVAAVFVGFVRRQIADVGLAFFDRARRRIRKSGRNSREA